MSQQVKPPHLHTTLFAISAMQLNSSDQDQDVFSISVLPDEDTTNPQCEPQLAFLSCFEVPNPFKSQMCSGAQLNCQNCIGSEMDSAVAYSPCIVDIDIEKGNLDTPKTSDETLGSLTAEGPLTNLQRALQRQLSFQIGGKFMQLLMNHVLMLIKFTSRDYVAHLGNQHTSSPNLRYADKSATERVHDTPNNRWRKYKRAASFDSRKIVLLFSVLSSMGTMVLIYLTLRVRQTGDGFVHV